MTSIHAQCVHLRLRLADLQQVMHVQQPPPGPRCEKQFALWPLLLRARTVVRWFDRPRALSRTDFVVSVVI